MLIPAGLLVFLLARALHFIPQVRPDAMHQFAELGRFLEFYDVAGTGQGHRNKAFHPAGLGSHDHDTVAEIDRLVDAVGDEYDGFLLLVPDAQKLFL